MRAARKLFAESGYQGATMRAIAAESKVDAALIHHFFLSKEGMFSAAVTDAFDTELLVTSVLAVAEAEGRGERLVRVFLGAWESPQCRQPLSAVLRSAMSHPDAARLLKDFISTGVVGRIVEATSPDCQELRAMLIGSHIIGLAVMRFVLKLEPIASASEEMLVSSMSPTVQRYLTGDIDSARSG